MAEEIEKKTKRRFSDMFGSKSAFTVYVICQSISILTLLFALLSFLTGRSDVSKFLTHLTLCVTAVILMNIPLFMRRRFKFYIPSFLQITVTLFIVLHFVFGEIFRVYDRSLLFDKMLHTTSGVVIAICGFSLVNLLNESPNTHLKLSPFFVALFSFCFALAIGYLWEMLEYTVDSITGINMQRWQDSFVPVIIDGEEVMVSMYGQGSGLIDTMMDMVVNAVGAAVISVVGYIMLKAKNPKIQALLIRRFKNPEKYERESEDAKQFFQSKQKRNQANNNSENENTTIGGTEK
jgi:hypothetical protein